MIQATKSRTATSAVAGTSSKTSSATSGATGSQLNKSGSNANGGATGSGGSSSVGYTSGSTPVAQLMPLRSSSSIKLAGAFPAPMSRATAPRLVAAGKSSVQSFHLSALSFFFDSLDLCWIIREGGL